MAFYSAKSRSYLAHKSTIGYFNAHTLTLNTSFRINYEASEHTVMHRILRSYVKSPIWGIEIMWMKSDRLRSISNYYRKEEYCSFLFKNLIRYLRLNFTNPKFKPFSMIKYWPTSRQKKKESSFFKKDSIFSTNWTNMRVSWRRNFHRRSITYSNREKQRAMSWFSISIVDYNIAMFRSLIRVTRFFTTITP